jgi:hypothetical protein
VTSPSGICEPLCGAITAEVVVRARFQGNKTTGNGSVSTGRFLY